MFNKKSEPVVVAESSTPVLTQNVANTDVKMITTIAKDSVFDGNLCIKGDIHIWGRVNGNIDVNDGMVKIMQGGYIEGEIKSTNMIIDGYVDGICHGQNLEILENGELNGISRVDNLSIRKGGRFVGKSELTEKQMKDDAKEKRDKNAPVNTPLNTASAVSK